MSVLGFKRLKASHAAILTWTSRQNAGIRIQHIKLNRSAQILHWTFKTVHMPPSLMFNPPLCLHSTFTRRTNGHCLRVFTAANSYPPSLMYPLHTPSNSASFFFFQSVFKKGSNFCYRRFLRGYWGRGCMGRIFSLQWARSILPEVADYHAEHSSTFTRWPLVIAVERPRCQIVPRHGRT